MAETTVTLESTLSALIEGKKYAALRDILVTMNPADVAAVFEETDELALPLLFRLLPKELAAETFVEMQPEQQELLIRGFSDTELKEVVDELYVDDAVDLVDGRHVDAAVGDFAQRQHGRLVVLGVDRRLDAVFQLARAAGGHQDQFETVVDHLQAVFDGDAGHAGSRRPGGPPSEYGKGQGL